MRGYFSNWTSVRMILFVIGFLCGNLLYSAVLFGNVFRPFTLIWIFLPTVFALLQIFIVDFAFWKAGYFGDIKNK